jgi:small ligand-binding sensory domain FIST
MAHMSRVWAAATVAAVRAQRERAPSAAAGGAGARDRLAGLAPQAAALAAARATTDDGRRLAGADESLRKAMYLTCWAPS